MERPTQLVRHCTCASPLLLLLLLLLPLGEHGPRQASAHSYQTCVGTDDLGAQTLCQGEKIYVYYNTNHGGSSGFCFEFDRQGGIEVFEGSSASGTAIWQKRPATSWSCTGYRCAQGDTISSTTCTGSEGHATTKMCKAPTPPTNQLDAGGGACSGSRPHWFRFGPITKSGSNLPANTYTYNAYGFGCQLSSWSGNYPPTTFKSQQFSVVDCVNKYAPYEVTTPCSGLYSCTYGSPNAPAMRENEPGNIGIAYLNYGDCDTCTSDHVVRPSCTVNGNPTLNTVNNYVNYNSGVTEDRPVYELAGTAGGRFAIDDVSDPSAPKLVTGSTPLDYEETYGGESWSCASTCNGNGVAGGAGIGSTGDGCVKCNYDISTDTFPGSSSGTTTYNTATHTWTLWVYVTDVTGCKTTGGTTIKSGPWPITVTVLNVNEAPGSDTVDPVVTSIAATNPMNSAGELREDCPGGVGGVIGSLTVNPSAAGDCGATGIACTFQCKQGAAWVTGNGANAACGGSSNPELFHIVGTQLRLASVSASKIDYERAQAVTVDVRVLVTNSITNTQITSKTQTLSIPVANVNEAPTTVVWDPTGGAIAENTAQDVLVGILKTVDPDCGTSYASTGCTSAQSDAGGGTDQTFTYTLPQCGGSPCPFKIANGNEIHTTNVNTNFESPGPAYSLTVRATDQGGLPTIGTAEVNFNIVVTDVLEQPTASNAVYNVFENKAPGEGVGNYGTSVTLGDGELAFSLLSGNNAWTNANYATTGGVVVASGTATIDVTDPTTFQDNEGFIKSGDQIEVRQVGKEDLTGGTTAVGASLSPAVAGCSGCTVQTKIPVDTTGWGLAVGDYVYVSLAGADSDLKIINGPKEIEDLGDGYVTIGSYLSAGELLTQVFVAGGSSVWPWTPAKSPNGVYTVTSVARGTPTTGKSRVVYTAKAGLPDGTYGASGVAFVAPFVIEECSGFLSVASNAINYEYRPTFSLTVQVRTGPIVKPAVITVDVLNVDEAPYEAVPFAGASLATYECYTGDCTATPAGAGESGNTPANIDITAHVLDPEGHDDFTMVVVNNAGSQDSTGVQAFGVTQSGSGTGTTRVLSLLTGAVLDYEAKPSFTLTLIASDNQISVDPELQVQVTATVTVNNVNEPPSFLPTQFYVAEDATGSFTFGPMAVIDPEGASGPSLQIMWTETVTATNLNTGNAKTMAPNERPFAWNGAVSDNGASANTGRTLTVNTVAAGGTPVRTLDYESISHYTLVIKACDQDGSGDGLCTSSPWTNVDAFVTDAQEPPVWDASSYTFYVSEGDTLGRVVQTSGGTDELASLASKVTDPDSGASFTFVLDSSTNSTDDPNGWLTDDVALTNELGKPLRVDLAAAALNPGSAPDFERPPAESGGGTSPLSPGAFKFKLEVLDNDGLSGGVATFTIEITDVNEAPYFSPVSRVMDENPTSAVTAYTEGDTSDTVWYLVDDDVHPGNVQTATYTITAGNTDSVGNILFTANPSGSGATQGFVIQAASSGYASIDFEAVVGGTFNIDVTVTDDGTPALSFTGTVGIELQDKNDAPVLPDAVLTIPEQSAAGECATPNVAATDEDDNLVSGPDTLTYSITLGNTNSVFSMTTIAGGTRQGQMCVATGKSTGSDFEYDNGAPYTAGAVACDNCAHTLTVTVTDDGEGGLTDSATVTLLVSNENDLPTFDPANVCASGTWQVPENAAVPGTGTVFGSDLVAADADIAAVSQTLAYTMPVDAENKFGVTPGTLVGGRYRANLKMLKALDYEAASQYTVRVRVTDSHTIPASIECDVTVVVVNVNEAPSGTFPSSLPGSASANAGTSTPDLHFSSHTLILTLVLYFTPCYLCRHHCSGGLGPGPHGR